MRDFLLNLLFPKRCVGCRRLGSFICDICFAKISFNSINVCSVCNKHSIDGATHPICLKVQSLNGVTSSISYKGLVKKLIYQFKYSPYLTSLNEVLGELMYEGLIQNESFVNILNRSPIIIDVPIHKQKFKKRGYNHSTLLARNLSEKLNLKFASSVLLRIKETKPQFALKKEERRENILGAFSLNPKFKNFVKDKSIVIVDDVTTSGATLNESAKILKRNGVKFVWGATLARE